MHTAVGIELRYWDDLPWEEVAERLGIAERTAKDHDQKIRRRLAAALAEAAISRHLPKGILEIAKKDAAPPIAVRAALAPRVVSGACGRALNTPFALVPRRISQWCTCPQRVQGGDAQGRLQRTQTLPAP